MKMIRMAALIAAAAAAVSKAKDYARQNPEKASDTLEKVEAFVAAKAGPTYAGKVEKGSHALRAGLGLPSGTGEGGAAATASGSAGSVTPPITVPPGSSGPSSEGVEGPEPTDPSRGFDPSI